MRIKTTLLVLFLFQLLLYTRIAGQQFKPDFESLEKVNPVPDWFKDAKFGIYFHWGVYSVPAFGNEWYPRNMYFNNSPENKHHKEVYGDPADWPYNNFITGAKDKAGNFVQFAPKLKSEGGQFDPDEWAQLFADAGAKFAGPVAEHHDGFSMWASKVNPWNAKDMGPKLDLVGLLTTAIRKKNMKVILSMHHAYNITGFYQAVPPTNDPELQILFGQQGKEKNEALWLNKHKEIIDNYKPDIVWQDFNLREISQPVLLGFLSYYYNKATEWKKQVVATYKDALNTNCAVLDYERGGPTDITENYWLTDDAISSSSWCYTEGIGYYSKKQVLHGFLDRISKNGNLLLNISPKADGTIPQEQKDILLAMGAWLKKYGEAVYATRAWEKYGEGPTKMGAAHGVFQAPAEGTAKDVRFTRSKDLTKLYAILLGWDKGQKEVVLTSLSKDRINCDNLESVQLISNAAGKYLPLTFRQTEEGLAVSLPEHSFDEMAYVFKLNFKGTIPAFNNYAEVNVAPPYYLIPGNKTDTLALNKELKLSKKTNTANVVWKLEAAGKGFYKIINREANRALTYAANDGLTLADFSDKDNQVWKVDHSYYGLYRISNKQYPSLILSAGDKEVKAIDKETINDKANYSFIWQLEEVCEQKVQAFKQLTIPGTIEAEDFNTGCPDEAYADKDETNVGGEYRTNEPVDIEKYDGGYDITRTAAGEWLTYTATIKNTGNYEVSFHIASVFDDAKMHLEADGIDLTGIITVPNTGGGQTWKEVKRTVKLEAGQHVLKLVIDNRGVHIDKMVFEEMK